MSDVVPQVDKKTEPPIEAQPAPRRVSRIIGAMLIIISVVLGWLLLVGFLGFQSGQRQKTDREQAELRLELDRQLTLAEENINQQNDQLALRRLDWVLEQDANNQRAIDLKATVQQTANQSLMPTPVQPAATPTPTAEPSPTPGAIFSPSDELQRIRRLSVRKE